MTENLAFLDKPTPTFDAREINRRAIQHFSIIYHMLVDMHGRPLGEVRRLNPNFVEQPHGIHRHDAPRLIEFRGPLPSHYGTYSNIYDLVQ
jgi:hypothetical protein